MASVTKGNPDTEASPGLQVIMSDAATLQRDLVALAFHLTARPGIDDGAAISAAFPAVSNEELHRGLRIARRTGASKT